MAAMNAMSGAMMGGGGMPGAPAIDYSKLYKAEQDNLDLVEYKWLGDDVEDRLLERYSRL